MTSRQTVPPVGVSEKYAPGDRFPERPRRTDMQNVRFRERPGHQTALARHYGSPETILIMGDMPVRRSFRRGLTPQILRYPDLLIAFGVDSVEAIARRGFAIDDQGKPPDFVLEIASRNTAENDYGCKRRDYAAFGIPEYWRFDPTGGDYYPAALAGDRLADGEYQPITVVRVDGDRHWGHSPALNLDVCWEGGQLRWYDPVARGYLRTHDEEADQRIAAEIQRDVAEIQRDAAEIQRDAERQARIAAEARVREVEEELRRRR